MNAPVRCGATSVKRARPFQATCLPTERALVNTHQLAYWCQWRLAIHAFCTGCDPEDDMAVDAHWARERRNEVIVANQAALGAEIRHLECQLGKQTSISAKLEAALSERGEALANVELQRKTANEKLQQLRVSTITFPYRMRLTRLARLISRTTQGPKKYLTDILYLLSDKFI